jgi:hypothetical protein
MCSGTHCFCQIGKGYVHLCCNAVVVDTYVSNNMLRAIHDFTRGAFGLIMEQRDKNSGGEIKG